MADCDFIQRMTRHRNFDTRCLDYRRQWNQLMETEIISREEHAIVRPLMIQMGHIVADALEAKQDCLSAEQVHRAYDDRTQALLDQENELAENGNLSVKSHGLARNVLMGYENVVRDALVAQFGSD